MANGVVFQRFYCNYTKLYWLLNYKLVYNWHFAIKPYHAYEVHKSTIIYTYVVLEMYLNV